MGKFNFIIFSLLFFFLANTHAQWQTDVRLTYNADTSKTSYNNARCIASSGNNVHVVWFDDLWPTSSRLFYKRSVNTGISWGVETRLSMYEACYPSISVSGSSVHVVWASGGLTYHEIFYKLSLDNGSTWGDSLRLTNNSGDSKYPSIATSGSVVHIVWTDDRSGGHDEIYYKSSTNGGLTWGADTRLTNSNSYDAWMGSIVVNGNLVNVVWESDRDGNTEIYQKRSIDGGGYWSTDTRLTNNTGASDYPSIAISGTTVHVVWMDNRDGNTEIYYKRSANSGFSFGLDTRLTNNSATSYYPSISATGSFVNVVWRDTRDGNEEIYYKRSTNDGVNWEPDTRLTNNTFSSTFPSVSSSGTAVHVAWTDNRNNGNPEIYYKRNPNGTVDINLISSNVPLAFGLSQNYPNPFNPVTNIKFQVSELSDTKLTLSDISGKVIEEFVNQQLVPGTYEVRFDASGLSSGVYFYRLEAGNYSETKRMVLLK
jgi:hypothetical protein